MSAGSAAGLIPDQDVRRDAYVVLDDEDRIVRVGPGLRDVMDPFRGHVLWERLPGAETLYRPYFEEARRSGQTIECDVFYAAKATRVRLVPAADGLAVHVERLRDLDVTTLGTLAESLRTMDSELAVRGFEQPGPRALSSPRALP